MPCVCDPVTSHGYHFVQFFGTYFSACVYTPRDIIGFVFGLVNICFWLFAQVPQLIKNYRNKSAESLSWSFLTLWLIGDVCNFLGCILTGQNATQLWTSIYFMLMDIITVAQWLYYRRRNKNVLQVDFAPETGDRSPVAVVSEDKMSTNGTYHTRSRALYAFAAAATLFLTVPAAAPYATTPVEMVRIHAAAPAPTASAAAAGSRQLLALSSAAASSAAASVAGAATSHASVDYEAVSPFPEGEPLSWLHAASNDATTPGDLDNDDETAFQGALGDDTPDICDGGAASGKAAEIIGITSAWICAIFYVWSRIPQIIHNYRRQSTEGLSLGLFLMASIANTFYGLSILIPTTTDFTTDSFWSTTFAYLIGSLGTNFFGIVIVWQFYRYKGQRPHGEDGDHAEALFDGQHSHHEVLEGVKMVPART